MDASGPLQTPNNLQMLTHLFGESTCNSRVVQKETKFPASAADKAGLSLQLKALLCVFVTLLQPLRAKALASRPAWALLAAEADRPVDSGLEDKVLSSGSRLPPHLFWPPARECFVRWCS